MVDEDEERARAWLHTWHNMPAASGEIAAAAGGAHLQVRSLDRATQRLTIDDEPWRLRTVLAKRGRR